MQDVVSGGRWDSVTRDQSVRKESNWAFALVADVIFDREQILVVDRNGAPEFESFAVVVGQSHGATDAEPSGAHLLPDGFRGWQLDVCSRGARPAELRIERVTGPRGGQQNDRRRFRVSRLAEFDERQIVDAPAFQGNRALQRVGRNGYARRTRQRRPTIGWCG